MIFFTFTGKYTHLAKNYGRGTEKGYRKKGYRKRGTERFWCVERGAIKGVPQKGYRKRGAEKRGTEKGYRKRCTEKKEILKKPPEAKLFFEKGNTEKGSSQC